MQQQQAISNEIVADATVGNDVQGNNSNPRFAIMDLLDMYVDGKDSVNNWCMAKIIEYDLETHRLTLHFDGWSTRYDEVSKLTNNYMKHTV